MIMLELKNISKSFSQRGLVLNCLNLRVHEGETLAVMGPSGSGKTTLMNIIGLLDKPDKGEILFRGTDTGNFSEDEAAQYRCRNIGFVFQDHLLLQHLTVLENILLPLIAAEENEDEIAGRRDNALQMMKVTGIDSLSGKYPGSISGGEAQRVALVRALVNRPSILLADEPTGSLDSGNAEILGELLVEMNRISGITLILATHSEKLAEKMSKVSFLSEGKLEGIGQ